MANHCYNYATGSGSEENLTRLKKVVEALADKDYKYAEFVHCYAKIYPMFFPIEVLEQEEDEDAQTNYWDVYENWGSKWFEANFEIDEEHGFITISGDSAWSPMLTFFSKLAKEYKLELEGYYDEPGMDFAGNFTIDSEGAITDNQLTSTQLRMQDNPEGFWADILDQIDSGCFGSLEEVIKQFDVDYWGELDKEDLVTLEKHFNAFLKSENE